MPTPTLTPARRLAAAIEPVAGQAQFAPECHANYAALGFGPSSGTVGRTELPDRSAYFTARGSVLGQVPGTVVAAVFAVFNPDVVVPLVAEGWQRTEAATIWAAREAGAVAHGGRGWTPDQLAAGEDGLRSRGLLEGDHTLTPTGFALRDRVEQRTDELVEPAVAAIGDRLDGIVATLQPWGRTIVESGGYLSPAVRFTFGQP